jgi:hypothetical protein
MSTRLSNPSVSLAFVAQASWRAMQASAASLVRPSTLRRARTQVVRLITVVAGH